MVSIPRQRRSLRRHWPQLCCLGMGTPSDKATRCFACAIMDHDVAARQKQFKVGSRLQKAAANTGHPSATVHACPGRIIPPPSQTNLQSRPDPESQPNPMSSCSGRPLQMRPRACDDANSEGNMQQAKLCMRLLLQPPSSSPRASKAGTLPQVARIFRQCRQIGTRDRLHDCGGHWSLVGAVVSDPGKIDCNYGVQMLPEGRR
jgi:hypothetical protein